MTHSPVAPLEAVHVPAQGSAAGLVVILHGWGGNPQELAQLVPYLGLPQLDYHLPAGPLRHPQLAQGRAWYDLSRIGIGPLSGGETGLPQTRQALHTWLEKLETDTGIPPARTILAGFSQGGAMTLNLGLQLSTPLAGLICLSGWLLELPPEPRAGYPPILIAHGRQDQVVPLSFAQRARDILQAAKVTLRYAEFEAGHEVTPEILTAVQAFIRARLSL